MGVQVMVMERLEGTPLSRLSGDASRAWARPLCRALAVAALAIIEGEVFHADLHSGNMLLCHQADRAVVGFVDFGVCGKLPPRLKDALLLQVAAAHAVI